MSVTVVGFRRMKAGEGIVVYKLCRMRANCDGVDSWA